MDYDALPEASTSTASYAPSTKLRAAPQQVTLPANTPFDLDAYASQYTGRRKILRCLFIARSSPQLAADAYTLALRELQEQTFDVELYETVATEFNSRPESAGRRYPLDDVWAERTRRHVADQTDKLDVELKNYITNLIKESIRMGQRDIGNFAYKSGDLQSALRAYIKTRDYCATANQILEQIFTVIDVALDMQNYTLIRNFVVKAEATYDTIYQAPAAAAAAAASGGGASAQTKTVQMPGMLPPDQSAASQRKTEADDRRKSMMADRIAVVSGVGEMGSGNYTKAARKLLGVSSYAKDDDAGHFITAGDIALYGTLCGLASFERPALKRLVIDNSNLRPMLELEPHLKDIVACFYASNYKGALELLERYHPRHVLDIHLSHHIDVLLSQIRSRAIVQYFAPFSTTSLGRMATAFGWTETLMQAEVVRLIGTKDLKARVDSRNKTVHAYAPSQRTALFKHAHDVGRQQTSATRALLWRMNLIAADIVVKAPKQSKEGNAEAGPSEEGDSKGSPKKKDESGKMEAILVD